MLRSSYTRFAVTCGVACFAPAAPALAQTLPEGSLSTVTLAAGQLFWAAPAGGGQVGFYTRPAAGGDARRLGTVRGDVRSVAFDGSNYAVALIRLQTVESDRPPIDEEDCGVCEPDEEEQQQVIVGTVDSAPRVLLTCTRIALEQARPAPAVAIVAGRTFFAGVGCDAPAGVGTVDAAGAVTSFDADGTLPVRGAGSWLTYGRRADTRVLNLAGGGSYSVPAGLDPSATSPLLRSLFLQGDGSIVLGGRFFRAGGSTAPVSLRPKWGDGVPDPLLAGDGLFYRHAGADLARLAVTSEPGPRTVVVPGLTTKRPLSLTGSVLDVAGRTCTGATTLRAVDLAVPAAAGATDGCPLVVTTNALRLTRKRTVTVAIRCANGCRGSLAMSSGDLVAVAKVNIPAGGRTKVRYRLKKRDLKLLGQSATFGPGSDWLTVSGRPHRLKR